MWNIMRIKSKYYENKVKILREYSRNITRIKSIYYENKVKILRE